MRIYQNLLSKILREGTEVQNRTGIKTLSLFGESMKFNLKEGFPIVTTKKIFFKGVVHELLWFLKGETNIKYLVDNGVHIWDEWADEKGELGPVYGKQWRSWSKGPIHSIDQIQNIINRIKTDPGCRRLIVSAWNVAELNQMALAPCHYSFQFRVLNNELHCLFNQRSADMFLGVPFNIASYALLTHMIAQVCGLKVGTLTHNIGDAHIYTNHLEQCKIQLGREPMRLPELWLNPEVTDINKFTFDDIKLLNYVSHPAIKGAVAV